MSVDEKELMQELKNIKDIKMDIVPAKELYGGTLRIVGLGWVYNAIVILFPIILFTIVHEKQIIMSLLFISTIMSLILSTIIYIIPAFILFGLAFKYILFKKGIAPHLKYGEVLRERFKKGAKITLLVHFLILSLIAIFVSPVKDSDIVFGILVGAFISVSFIVFFIFGCVIEMEVTRLGGPHALELLKDVLSRKSSKSSNEGTGG